MQTHGGQQADDAITGRERSFSARLLVDWDRDGQYAHPLSDMSGYASKISTDRALKGSAPEEITLIEGAAAAELTATVAGEHDGLPLTAVFSPYNGRSPFYLHALVGCEVTYSIDLHTVYGTVTYPQFVGVLRSTEPTRGDSTVEITALDRVEALREAISVPPWAIVQRLSEQGSVRGQLCDSQWIIDHCLRQCDVSPTGNRPTYKPELGVGWDALDGVHFWLSGTGSMLPTKGWMDNAITVTVPQTESGGPEMYNGDGAQPAALFDEGPSPLCLNAIPEGSGNPIDEGAQLKYWAQDRDLMDTEGTHYLGFTLVSGGSEGDAYKNVSYKAVQVVNIGEDVELRLVIHQGTVYTELAEMDTGTLYPSTSLTIGDSYNWQTISAIWDYSAETGVRCYLNIGEYTSTDGFEPQNTSVRSGGSGYWAKGLIHVNHWVKMQDVCYATRNIYDPSTNFDHNVRRSSKYQALLDPGKNRFTYMPVDQNGSDAWDIISNVAAAEWGSVFWDEDGIFRFWNYDTMLSKQSTTTRALSLDDVTGLSARNSLDSIRNVFSVKTTKKVSVQQKVYDASDENEFYVPGGTDKIFRVWDNSIMSVNPREVQRHTTIPNAEFSDGTSTNYPKWNDAVTNGYVVQWFFPGEGWKENNTLTSGVHIYPYFDIEGRIVISIGNYYNEDCRLVTDSGDPALRFTGTKIVESDPQLVTTRFDESIGQYGKRNMELSGDWYQDHFQSQGMIDTIAQRTTKPVPVTDDLTIAGDPRLQLGDTLEIHDPDGFGARLKAQILGITRELDASKGLTDTLTVELIRPPGQWILGSPSYSVLGQSTILG